MTHPLWLHLQRKYNSVLVTSRKFIWFLLPLTLLACTNDRWEVNLNEVQQSTAFKRFDVDFYETDSANFPNQLEKLIQAYPIFFTTGDSILWYDQRFDRKLLYLKRESNQAIPPVEWEQIESDLSDALKRYYALVPDASELTVYTRIADLDFQYPVIFVDSLDFVAIELDVFLGENHPEYSRIPNYIKRRFTPEHIAPRVMEEIAASRVAPADPEFSLIEDMVRAGIIRFFQSTTLTEKPMHYHFGYTPEQIQFCEDNEATIWMYFVQNQLLFDSSLDTKRRFVLEAPFSKFYTEVDNQTPGRIAEWLGFRIVQSYVKKHPDISMQELMETTDYKTLFRNSGYKPS